MTKPRSYQTEAIIIRKVKLGEADRILTLYSPDLGKIQGVAKGVRRPKSKLAGHLELLTHSQVSLARGRKLDTITGSQTITSFLAIKDDLWLTSCGLYMAELVNQFTPDSVPNQALFQLLAQNLTGLVPGESNELALRHFEVHLLTTVGYRPELHDCVVCKRPLRPEVNHFSASAGGVVCPDCAPSQANRIPLSLDALKVLRFVQDNDLAAARRLRLKTALARDLEYVIGEYFRYILERDVRSALWLRNLREQMRHMKPAPKPLQATTDQTG